MSSEMEIIIRTPRPQIVVTRKEFSDTSTIGELTLDRAFECYTLEDSVRLYGADGILQEGEKIPGLTAIPCGKYRLVLANSARFGYCPWILNVPFFTDIRIHPLNKSTESEGCIGVGRIKGPDWIGESRAAFKTLVEKLDALDETEELWIEVCGGMTAEQLKDLKLR